jgi:hypothetical protein
MRENGRWVMEWRRSSEARLGLNEYMEHNHATGWRESNGRLDVLIPSRRKDVKDKVAWVETGTIELIEHQIETGVPVSKNLLEPMFYKPPRASGKRRDRSR